MQNVPHWQWLMVIYFLLVGIPVMLVHMKVKKRVLEDKTPLNLLIYFACVTGMAFLMHFITMLLYFKFIFGYKS
jgi:hypothetical protein